MSFRRPGLIFDGLRETSNMIFVLIQLMYFCEWGFIYAPARWYYPASSPVSVDCFSVGQLRL